VFFDVDGVLTDGGIIYDNLGNEIKKFNVKDGLGIFHLRRLGFIVGAITGRNSPVVAKRCEELKLDFHYHGALRKIDFYEKAKEMFALKDEQIAYIGDDLLDVPVFRQCGLSACPADARGYIQQECDLVMPSKGGEGALRDLIDLVLFEQGLFDDMLAYHLA
jgi:3-deoxy-D-manno-octulosonate 8-phosphate phosphatase (KDO 8-P phosphatase)